MNSLMKGGFLCERDLKTPAIAVGPVFQRAVDPRSWFSGSGVGPCGTGKIQAPAMEQIGRANEQEINRKSYIVNHEAPAFSSHRWNRYDIGCLMRLT